MSNPQVNEVVQSLAALSLDVQQEVYNRLGNHFPKHRVPKPGEGRHFAGKLHERVQTYLDDLDNTLIMSNCTNPDLQLRYAISTLEGTARDWWQGFSADLASCSPEKRWQAFRAGILEQFRGIDTERIARDKLYHLRQGRMSIQEYCDRVRHLNLDIPTNHMAMQDRVQTFLRGLDPQLAVEIQVDLEKHGDVSLNLAMTIAQTRTMYRVEAQRFHQPNPRRNHPQYHPRPQHNFHHRRYEPRSEAIPMEVNHVTAPRASVRSHHRNASVPRLSPTERARRLENNLCFRCGSATHRAINCPLSKN